MWACPIRKGSDEGYYGDACAPDAHVLTTRGMLPASDVDIERAVTADCRKGIADTRIRIMVSGEGLGLLDGEKLMRCRLRGRRVSEVAAQNEGRTALRRNSPPKKSIGVLK